MMFVLFAVLLLATPGYVVSLLIRDAYKIWRVGKCPNV